jgi:hypothetical protein
MRRMRCTGAGIEPARPCAGAHQSGAVPSYSAFYLTSASRARTCRAVSLADRPPSSSLGCECRVQGPRAREVVGALAERRRVRRPHEADLRLEIAALLLAAGVGGRHDPLA